jgi:LysM domain
MFLIKNILSFATKPNLAASAGRLWQSAGWAVRAGYTLDSGIEATRLLFNQNLKDQYAGNDKQYYVDLTSALVGTVIGAGSIKKSAYRSQFRKALWGYAAVDAGIQVYKQLNQLPDAKSLAEATRLARENALCAPEAAEKALKSNVSEDGYFNGKVNAQGALTSHSEMVAPIKAGVQAVRVKWTPFFVGWSSANDIRAGIEAEFSTVQTPIQQKERKYGSGALELGFRKGWDVNDDPAALTDASSCGKAATSIARAWGNNAFIGNETVLSLRADQTVINSRNGYQPRDVHEAKLFTNFGISNGDRSRAFVAEADIRGRIPATWSDLGSALSDLFKGRKPTNMEASASFSPVVLKFTYNPVIMTAKGEVITQTPWEFFKSAFSFGLNKQRIPDRRVLPNGDVLDVSTQEGRSAFAQNQSLAESNFGQLMSQRAVDLTGQDAAFASAITFKLPSAPFALTGHKTEVVELIQRQATDDVWARSPEVTSQNAQLAENAQSYTVQKGDTLAKIAFKTYPELAQYKDQVWKHLFAYNRHLMSPDALLEDDTLSLPDISQFKQTLLAAVSTSNHDQAISEFLAQKIQIKSAPISTASSDYILTSLPMKNSHGQIVNEIMYVQRNGKTYFSPEGVIFALNQQAKISGNERLANIQADYILRANESQFRSYNLNGRTVRLIEAGRIIDIGAFAQGATCIEDKSFEGLFIRAPKLDLYNLSKPQKAPTNQAKAAF